VSTQEFSIKTIAVLICLLLVAGSVVTFAQSGGDARRPVASGASSEPAREVDHGLLNEKLETLFDRVESRLADQAGDRAGLDQEVDALRADLTAAQAQIEVLKATVVEALAAQLAAEARLHSLEASAGRDTESEPAAGADPDRPSKMSSVLSYAEGLSRDPEQEPDVDVAAGPPAPGGQMAAGSRDYEVVGRARAATPDATERAASNPPVEAVEPAAGPASAEGAATVAGPAEDELKVGEVHFDSGSADLTPGAQRNAREAAKRIGSMEIEKVRVIGYTDTTGSRELNKHLSLMRAGSIAELLHEVGVPSERIEIVGAGEDSIPEPTGDGVSEPLNRCAGVFVTVGYQK
jgi:outer membrane protein OmpA-like peptidoglycan-associated protein